MVLIEMGLQSRSASQTLPSPKSSACGRDYPVPAQDHPHHHLGPAQLCYWISLLATMAKKAVENLPPLHPSEDSMQVEATLGLGDVAEAWLGVRDA